MTGKYIKDFKSKTKGGLLATCIPSAGHAYVDKWWPKGSLFLLGEAGLVTIALNQEDDNNKLLFLSIAAGLKIWEIIDAVNETDKYNENVEEFNKNVEKFNQYIKSN